MNKNELLNALERSPVIAAVTDESFEDALRADVEIIFYLRANLASVGDKIALARKNNKIIFVHIDLAEGIAKDRAGVIFLSSCGADGIISTRNQLINYAREEGLLTVQRFFALDSQGLSAMKDIIRTADFIEVMPGVVPKIIERFTNSGADVIAGGLIETKEEVMAAINAGTVAVSTGKKTLWDM